MRKTICVLLGLLCIVSNVYGAVDKTVIVNGTTGAEKGTAGDPLVATCLGGNITGDLNVTGRLNVTDNSTFSRNLTVTRNITAGDNITADWFIGNGSALSGIGGYVNFTTSEIDDIIWAHNLTVYSITTLGASGGTLGLNGTTWWNLTAAPTELNLTSNGTRVATVTNDSLALVTATSGIPKLIFQRGAFATDGYTDYVLKDFGGRLVFTANDSTSNTTVIDLDASNNLLNISVDTIIHEKNLTAGGWFNFVNDTNTTDYYYADGPMYGGDLNLQLGTVVFFRANNSNTGACALGLSGAGTAKALKVLHDQDPPDNYIEAGSIVVCVYDGTNFQILSPDANP